MDVIGKAPQFSATLTTELISWLYLIGTVTFFVVEFNCRRGERCASEIYMPLAEW